MDPTILLYIYPMAIWLGLVRFLRLSENPNLSALTGVAAALLFYAFFLRGTAPAVVFIPYLVIQGVPLVIYQHLLKRFDRGWQWWVVYLLFPFAMAALGALCLSLILRPSTP